MPRDSYSVTEISRYIRSMFEQDFLLKSNLSVRGEASNVKYHSSGHLYFTLKDEGGALPSVMWRSAAAALPWRLRDGDGVVCTGQISIYEKDGRYQFYVRKLKRDGEGDLYRRYEELKKELEEMGMFAPEYKRPIPRFASRVGIVTSETGAAIRDIQNIAFRRNPWVELVLCPALVQGEGAVPSLVSAIRRLDREGMDVMIVGRGGGSMEDLWAFNEEPVVRAVFECQTPVISAVGHETDTVLTDLAADLRAPTPSAAAELAVYDALALKEAFASYREELERSLERRVSERKREVARLSAALKAASPAGQLDRKRMELTRLSDRMDYRMEQLLREKAHALRLLAGRLSAVSPLQRIGGGYAYLRGEGGDAVRSVRDLSPGERVRITLGDGEAYARIEETIDEREA